eukprot:scaffold3606_cov76-Skeletonema_dohrnii-CCMP3373.AAC.2
MIIDALPRLLNRTSFLVALISISWYCILVATGEYAKWSYPILIGAAICKLTSVATSIRPRWQNHEDSNGSSSSSSFFNTHRQRLSSSCCSGGLLRSIYKSIAHRISNDNHQNNLDILSTAIILLPCIIFYIRRVIRHLSKLADDGHYNHDELANDFGKLSAASLSFLLLPVSKHSALLSSLNLGEIQVVRMHIYAGTCAIVAGVLHGLYYTWIWIAMDEYTYRDVFPGAECFQKAYDKHCHTKFVNLLGIINGVGFVILGCTALRWVRRHYFNIFYYVHIALATALLFGLVMHYNKMIWFIAPSLLSYVASNVPVAFESFYKWSKGGVGISKVVCIPDSRGCVELTIATIRNDYSGEEARGGCEQQQRAIGKYVRLTVPEISSKNHPFTAFCDPLHPQDVKILFRPIGTFTTQLSKRLQSLVTSPELTPSELTVSNDTRQCPKMLVNGVSTSSDLLGQAMKHDIIVVIAGGVGIVPYISLLAALRDIDVGRQFNNDGEQHHIQKTRHVHVHWVSRDEGLIRYIVENYFSLHRQGAHDSNPAIKISVHHTNEQTSPMSSTSNNDESDTLTEFVVPPETARSLASPTSLYEASKRSLLHNVLPASVFASIVFGGLWIVSYCYENIQDKHVIETRPVSVIGIIVWSIVISIGSLALVKMTDTISRVVQYSKLESNECVDEENGIECGVISPQDGTDHFTMDDTSRGDDEDQQIEIVSASVKKEDHRGLDDASISHSQGRPDLESIIKTAFESARDEETDVGVFMCGPSPLTTAVSRAIRHEEKRERCVPNPLSLSHEPRAYVYQEMFEL